MTEFDICHRFQLGIEVFPTAKNERIVKICHLNAKFNRLSLQERYIFLIVLRKVNGRLVIVVRHKLEQKNYILKVAAFESHDPRANMIQFDKVIELQNEFFTRCWIKLVFISDKEKIDDWSPIFKAMQPCQHCWI